MRSGVIAALVALVAASGCGGGDTYSIDATKDCLAGRGIDAERSNDRVGASGGVLRLPDEVAIHFGKDADEAESLANELTKVVAVNSLGDHFRTEADRTGNAVVSVSLSAREERPRTFEAAEKCLRAAEPSEPSEP